MKKAELEKQLKKAQKKIKVLEHRLRGCGATYYGFEPTTGPKSESVWRLKGI